MIKFKLAMCTLAALGSVYSASAMNRWTALSMLETGDNDNVIGSCGARSLVITRAVCGNAWNRSGHVKNDTIAGNSGSI